MRPPPRQPPRSPPPIRGCCGCTPCCSSCACWRWRACCPTRPLSRRCWRPCCWPTRPALRLVDYSLLLTFAAFFVFYRQPRAGARVLGLAAGAAGPGGRFRWRWLASQVISNVPAALLLSGFTGNVQALIVGTNLGGLGTLIASMASLISYRQIARETPQRKGEYFLLLRLPTSSSWPCCWPSGPCGRDFCARRAAAMLQIKRPCLYDHRQGRFYVFVLFRQVDVVRQALDIDRRQLGLDQRHRVGDDSGSMSVWSALIHSSGTFFSRLATSLIGLQLGRALIRRVGHALDGDHLAGVALERSLDRRAADLVRLGDVGAAGDMPGAALQRGQLDAAGLGVSGGGPTVLARKRAVPVSERWPKARPNGRRRTIRRHSGRPSSLTPSDTAMTTLGFFACMRATFSTKRSTLNGISGRQIMSTPSQSSARARAAAAVSQPALRPMISTMVT